MRQAIFHKSITCNSEIKPATPCKKANRQTTHKVNITLKVHGELKQQHLNEVQLLVADAKLAGLI